MRRVEAEGAVGASAWRTNGRVLDGDWTVRGNLRPFMQLCRFPLTKYRTPSVSRGILSMPLVYIVMGLERSHDMNSSLLPSSAILSSAAEYVNPAPFHNKL